jgi:hypothetical protein
MKEMTERMPLVVCQLYFSVIFSLNSQGTKLNLFETDRKYLNSWGDINGMYCVCASDDKRAEATCYPTQYLNCTISRSITSTKCNVQSRRKRSNDGSYKDDKELDRLLKLMTPKESPIETRVKV